ncbi:Hsp20/alpha crystallin family protein [Marinobacter sp. HL-58]|uniref:Hsp20/alpha crystallin family protein n=1 Tax=Marinobacter sp. HL-58 TaxID=1479237 RepID=UPI0004822D37|nr:Hsp20/alpha crystallin family protein [Marinobacter sp. HL-58]KPP98870.1 MAG: HSP20 family protein [Marinobacter sp. HL-58]
MRNLIKRDKPSLPTFQQEMERFFNERLWPFSLDDREHAGVAQWAPAVDVKEDKDRFVVTADVPGVDPKDIEVNLENGVLTIRGEREEEKEDDDKGWHRVERFTGSFFRRFDLPGAADASQVTAKSDKGVLKIEIPRSEKSQNSRIEVKG